MIVRESILKNKGIDRIEEEIIEKTGIEEMIGANMIEDRESIMNTGTIKNK